MVLESDVNKSGDPYTEIMLCIYPSQVHIHSSENTHHEHTPEDIYAAAAGEQLGVRCLAQGHFSRGIEVERESAVHSFPPHRKTCLLFFFNLLKILWYFTA